MLALTLLVSTFAASASPVVVCGLARTHVGQVPASARLVAWGRFLTGESRTLAWLDAKAKVFVFDGGSRRASAVSQVDAPTAAWAWDDIDRDTRDDLVVGGPAWLESPGPGGAQTWEAHTQAKAALRAIKVVDLDADGKLDLVVGTTEGAIVVWRQVRKQQWDAHEVVHQGGGGWTTADMNADGRSDLVFADGWYETPVDVITGEWKHHALLLPRTHKDATVFAFDVNADKRIDVVVASPQAEGPARVTWYQAPENPNAPWQPHVVFVSTNNTPLQVLPHVSARGTSLIIGDQQGHLTQAELSNVGGLRSECVLSRSFRGDLHKVASTADETNSFIATETNAQGRVLVVRWQTPAAKPDQTPTPQPKTRP
ncbi:MAG: VCBS repeat-containing protein [Deltaproteobacteria bacterium]|nr:VCBS repeat-containing protein [Deltaproteobacteria bacterium]